MCIRDRVKTVDGRISKMKLTATELAHYMAPGVNLGNTMEACDWNDVFTNQAGPVSYTHLSRIMMYSLFFIFSKFDCKVINNS